MYLHFTLKINKSNGGEEWVPYVTSIIKGILKQYVKSDIVYEPQMSKNDDYNYFSIRFETGEARIHDADWFIRQVKSVLDRLHDVRITYETWMTKPDTYYETIEQDAYEQGRMAL